MGQSCYARRKHIAAIALPTFIVLYCTTLFVVYLQRLCSSTITSTSTSILSPGKYNNVGYTPILYFDGIERKRQFYIYIIPHSFVLTSNEVFLFTIVLSYKVNNLGLVN